MGNFPPEDDHLFIEDDEDFGDDPFGDLMTPFPPDEEVAEDLHDELNARNRRWPTGTHRVKPELPEIALAKEVLKDKGRLIFNQIASDKNGEVYQVVRRKGEARPGIIKHDGKQWRFYPQMNFHFNVEELDEIADFMETLI